MFEKFVYKHSKIIEYVNTLIEIYKLNGKITREFLGLRMQNFQGTAFI